MLRVNLWFKFLLGLLILPILTSCGSGDTYSLSGKSAPNFSLTNAATNEMVSLSDFSGQPVLLYFHMAVG